MTALSIQQAESLYQVAKSLPEEVAEEQPIVDLVATLRAALPTLNLLRFRKRSGSSGVNLHGWFLAKNPPELVIPGQSRGISLPVMMLVPLNAPGKMKLIVGTYISPALKDGEHWVTSDVDGEDYATTCLMWRPLVELPEMAGFQLTH